MKREDYEQFLIKKGYKKNDNDYNAFHVWVKILEGGRLSREYRTLVSTRQVVFEYWTNTYWEKSRSFALMDREISPDGENVIIGKLKCQGCNKRIEGVTEVRYSTGIPDNYTIKKLCPKCADLPENKISVIEKNFSS